MITNIGKVEILMFSDNHVEVRSNFVDNEQVREVLNMAVKAMKPLSSFGGLEIGKATADLGPKVR